MHRQGDDAGTGDPDLQRLAALAGIEPGYTDVWGVFHPVTERTIRAVLAAMGIPAETPAAVAAALAALSDLAGPPPADPDPDALADARAWHPDDMLGPEGGGLEGEGRDAGAWGIAVQLYGLRSRNNWGIGDFGDLARLMGIAAGLGADFVGISPVHAAFPGDPGQYSPYSPSHRSFLNILHLSVPDLPDFADCAPARDLVTSPGFQQRLALLRGAELVDYPAVAALKRPVLELLFLHFRDRHLAAGTARARAFHRFREERGEALHRLTLFEAMSERLGRDEVGRDWRRWPAEMQDPDQPGSRRIAAEAAERLTFFAWAQWEAEAQILAAAAAARDAGMRIGLYRDMAVANSPAGAAAWGNPGIVLPDAGVGAPPDVFSPLGQNWGLAALSPLGLRRTGYRLFLEDLRASMVGSGAVRIDHAMGLQHLFFVPGGLDPKDGAYVASGLADLRRLLVDESRAHRCLVVGEDLGTVPDGFRPAMAAAGVLSTRVLWFERGADGAFLPPDAYPADSAVAFTTHDLPTCTGWWTGRDIDWRERLSRFRDAADAHAARAERRQDRALLTAALARAGAWPDAPDLGAGGDPGAAVPPGLVPAIHRFLAQTPGRLLVVQAEDLLGEGEQPNLPGTRDEHPNWRRRLPLPIDMWGSDPGIAAVVAAIRAER
ncbi:MAG: hypothetical protein RLY86_3550 [Pseudomonadota bacterium]